MAKSSRAKKIYGDVGIDFMISADELLDFIGAGESLSKAGKDRKYADSIIDVAFARANDRFDTEAIALGMTGYLAHMFEWGTLGINTKKTNVRIQPNSERAKLWDNYNEGSGFDRTLWFAYKPSVAIVPKPTSKETGMSASVIRKLRDHVFHWKARVMEEGTVVIIKPKKAKMLLLPAYKRNQWAMRPHDLKRGYTMRPGPLAANPGYGTYAGNFTKFWQEFWNGTGADIIDEQIEKMINEDYVPELMVRRTSRSLRPVGRINVSSEVARRAKKTSDRVNKKAKARRMST